MFKDTIQYIQNLYGNAKNIPLHAPIFSGHEKQYLLDVIDSTFVSSVGEYVNQFEAKFANFVGAKKAVVTCNGTAALHAAMHLIGVGKNDEVITQALTFVATANAISYCGAYPIFVDSDQNNLGMSADSLEFFFSNNCEVRGHECVNKKTNRIIKACVPMHVFGHPVEIQRIVQICDKYCVSVIEDAAESLGSIYDGTHTGLFGKIGVFSFNGNKIITAGGGGMIVTNDDALGAKAKHLTTTAKLPHQWDFYHDEIGFNYRMPNLNAALALAQLEQLSKFIENKRQTAALYKDYFFKKGIRFLVEPPKAKSNYWLNAIFLENRDQRDAFLRETNAAGVMTRPVWTLMPDLPMYKECMTTELSEARRIADSIVNIPSSVRAQ